MRILLAALLPASLLLPAPAWSADRPGYGVVQSITPLKPEPSASAGGSSASQSKRRPGYLVRVKMDDGSVQVRQVKKVEVRSGQRALVTNAGDVLPE